MTISINNPPALSGLKLRHFQGEADYPHLAEVLTASENADQMDRHVTADDLARAFPHLSNCDPYKDLVIAEVDGNMVGYSRGWWEDAATSERIYPHNGFLVPAWRRHGIGQALFTAMEQRLREVAASHPPELVKLFQVNITQFQLGTTALLEHSGYQPVRYFYLMVRPTLDNIPDLPLPAGVEVRPVLPDHYRQVWQLGVETSQDEWGHHPPTEEEYQEWLSSPQFQPDLWQVAWDVTTNRVIGQVLTFVHHAENDQFNRKRGYTEGIGVTKTWRRRGIAGSLIMRSLRAQKAAGMTESALVVDTDNPSGATHLYESCGFQVVKRDTLYRKPLSPG